MVVLATAHAAKFPDAVEAMLGVGVVGRAIERGVVGLRCFDLRSFAPDGRIDDMPYGGGAGMVVRVDVVARALEEVYGVPAREVRESRDVLVTEPGGRAFDQQYARELAGGLSGGRGMTIICGRYGGIDERVRSELASGTVSVGNFVLSGGEVAAAAVLSTGIEVVQLYLASRATDVDDVLFNTLGAMLGACLLAVVVGPRARRRGWRGGG